MSFPIARRLSTLALAVGALPLVMSAQTPLPRPIHREIPLTNMIRRAFTAGTRDSTGRPGRNYWQLRTDYRISARLDPATGILTGTETLAFQNTSDTPMRQVVLRLDQNLFAPNVPRAEALPSLTDGMKVTRLVVNGTAVDLTPAAGGRGAGGRGAGAAPAPTRIFVNGLNQTVATMTLPTPIAAGASATIEADWNFRVPLVAGARGLRMGSWGDSLFQVAQWYPRLAMYDDLRGWDTDPYLRPVRVLQQLPATST
ncbi:MAG: hypothetical protein IPP98_10325 [Gemmatimonadetes bacterium]|nr:hypothetical protein [Gemmatimonadota bacterium]